MTDVLTIEMGSEVENGHAWIVGQLDVNNGGFGS